MSASKIGGGQTASTSAKQRNLARKGLPAQVIGPVVSGSQVHPDDANREWNPAYSSIGKHYGPDAADEELAAFMALPTDVQKIATFPAEKAIKSARHKVDTQLQVLYDHFKAGWVDERNVHEAQYWREELGWDSKLMEWIKGQVATNMWLTQALSSGLIESEDDIQMLFHLMRADVELNINPGFDLGGVLTKEVGQNLTLTNVLSKGYRHPMWYVFRYTGTDDIPGDGASAEQKAAFQLQQEYKVAILRRVMPAMRDRPKDIVMKFLVKTQAGQLGDGAEAFFRMMGVDTSVISPVFPGSAPQYSAFAFPSAAAYWNRPN